MPGRMGHLRQLWELNWKAGVGLDVEGYRRSMALSLDEVELLLRWNRDQHRADIEAIEAAGRK